MKGKGIKVLIFIIVAIGICGAVVYGYQEQKRSDAKAERLRMEFVEYSLEAAKKGDTSALHALGGMDVAQQRLDAYHAKADPVEDCKLAKQYISERLKDPESAKMECGENGNFRTDEGRAVSVKVNAKNGFGAYTGYKEWFVVFKANDYEVIPLSE